MISGRAYMFNLSPHNMKITLRRVNDAVKFEATNERGNSVFVEGGSSEGSANTALSPTELLLVSQASCTAVDIVELLRKMRQPLEHLEIVMEGKRAEDQLPKIFTHIHLH